MDYFLTRDVTGLDIWRMTCPGYVLHVKRVLGRIENLMPHIVGKAISVLIINPWIVICRQDLVELEGLAAMECLDIHASNAESLTR